jgi:hypothetical protein
MRFLPTRIHGVIDYAWGVLLILTPFMLAFSSDATALWIAIAFGVVGIVYSFLTDYELGGLRLLSMPVHLSFSLKLDNRASWVFLLFGLFAIVASLITRTSSDRPSRVMARQGTN